MATTTYTPLATITLGSNAATVTFSSISQSYRHLVMVLNGKSNATADLAFRLNSANSNYFYSIQVGTGSSISSNVRTSADYIVPGYGILSSISANQTNCIVNLFDYSITDKAQHYLIRTNDTSQMTAVTSGRWNENFAITGITCYALGTTFQAGTTVSLYGIVG